VTDRQLSARLSCEGSQQEYQADHRLTANFLSLLTARAGYEIGKGFMPFVSAGAALGTIGMHTTASGVVGAVPNGAYVYSLIGGSAPAYGAPDARILVTPVFANGMQVTKFTYVDRGFGSQFSLDHF
jgi:hypothetical protein